MLMPVAEQGPGSLSDRPAAALVGRSAEIAAVRRMAGRARLVSIVGPPGVGKTAVGMAAAAAMHPGFADGAWVVPLDSLSDAQLLPHTVAVALNVPDQLSRSQVDALVDGLRERRLLLVLDNCEHLASACADLAMKLLLTRPCPGVRIVATSREPLGVPGGLTVMISPLPLRHAVTMFGQRAAQVESGFRVTAANQAMVEAICGQVDRLPLGIGLAAQQLAAGSLEELWSRLRSDRWFLRDTAGAPPRQQTLRSAIGWSHQLCTPAERLLWARLSVFAGPFRLQDAQDVCADRHLASPDVADAVGSLATRSILATDLHADGQVQYSLPGTARAYGAEMLTGLGEETDGQRRYRAWLEARPGGTGTAGGIG